MANSFWDGLRISTIAFWDTAHMSEIQRAEVFTFNANACGEMAEIRAHSRKVIEESRNLIRRVDDILARDHYPHPWSRYATAEHASKQYSS